MNRWPIDDAEAHFDEMIEACRNDGPQMVTLGEKDVAVLVSIGEWRQLKRSARPTFKELLLAKEARADIPVLMRGKWRRRVRVDSR